jgi:MFS family permease
MTDALRGVPPAVQVAGTSQERPYGWVVAAVSLAMMTIGMGSAYIMVVALKPIALELGWPRAAPSLCYSLVLLGTGVGGIPMGWWSDRMGMGPPAFIGALMIGAGALLAGSSDSKLELYVAHGLLMGLLGNAALMAPLIANVTRWFDRRRGVAVAIVATGQGLAGVLWPPLLHPLVEAYGWRGAFDIYALIALCSLVPLSLLLCPRAAATEEGRPRGAGSDRVLGLPPALVQAALCTAAAGCFVATAVPVVHLAAYATDLGHPGPHAVRLLSLLLGCAVVSRLAFGLAADRIGGLRTLLISAGGQAMALAMFMAVESTIGLHVVATLFGLAYGGIMPGFAMVARDLFAAEQTGRRIGIVLLFGTVGMALGGWLGGFIFDVTGAYRTAFMVGVASNAMAVALISGLVYRETRGGAAVRGS